MLKVGTKNFAFPGNADGRFLPLSLKGNVYQFYYFLP